MSDVNGTINLDDGGVPQYTNGHHGSSSEAKPYQLIPTAWLKVSFLIAQLLWIILMANLKQQKKAWPDNLKAALRNYMLTHQFFNYKSTQYESSLHLNSIVQQLQYFFDQTDWDISIHPAKLKEKVCHQIHKIRAELEKDAKDPVLELRAFLQKVPREKRGEGMSVVLEVWGRETVKDGLGMENVYVVSDVDATNAMSGMDASNTTLGVDAANTEEKDMNHLFDFDQFGY